MADVMKKYMIFAAIAAAVLAAGCAKENLVQPEQGSVLKASLSSLTKTAIDGVKVTWTEGDAINVNGANSYAITEAAATATFEFKTALTAPYKAVYPTTIYKDASTVTLPSALDADKVFTPLAGYLESGETMSFKALTAFLKISLTGEATTTVKDLTLKGLGDEQLSGDFAIDFTTFALTGSSTADADKVVKLNINKALSATPLVLYIPIPAGNYASGYQIEMIDSEGGMMRKAVTARTVKAGELRDMGALAFEVNVTEDPNIGGIPDAKEFKDFAAAVNEGRSFSRWINESTGAVELLADIDFGGEEWTPVGNASVTTSNVITGSAFTGIFDGKGHTVDNFKVSVPASGANVAAGLFGVISGASVKNLVIGGNAVIKSSSNTGFVTMGAAVGFASESTLENIDSYAKMVADAGKDNVRLVVGGAIGTMFSSETKASTAKDIKGHASFDVVNTVNTKNGATGFIVGGVIGLTDGKNVDVVPVKVENAVNYSDFSVQATRTAGVIGTMNTFSIAEGCANYGNISCTDVKASNSRVAGIVSAMGNSTALKNCVNYGDVVFAVSGDSTHGYAGGVAGQTNDANSFTYFDGCANYGAVLSDRWFASSDDKYMGIICANFNAKVVTVKNCILGGKIGPYTPTNENPVITITSENFSQYYSLTAATRTAKVVFENNTYGTYAAPGISTAQDLKDFAAAYNAGADISKWTNADGVVVLLDDIDCSSITEWTPIGNCTLTSTWAHNKVETSGKLFTGTFDGKNHTIKNLHLSFAPTEANGAFGFFGGIGDGGVVKNIIFDNTCALNIETGKAGVFGMLAGLVLDGSVDNVKNYAPITGGGTSGLANNNAAGRVTVGGLIGWVHAATKDVTVSNLYNAGAIGTSAAEFTRGGNGGNGANGFMVGGVVGFSSNTANEQTQTLSNLKNDADIYTNAGRASGIVSAANRYTIVKGAENNGDIHHSASGSFRLGAITCITAVGCVLEDCVNKGDLIAPGVASAAGICCLVNDDTVKITNCSSLGATIVCTGFDTENNKVTYAGAFYGQCNKLAAFSGCSVSGKVGKTADALVTLTAENYFPFVGQVNEKNTTISKDNIKFAE